MRRILIAIAMIAGAPSLQANADGPDFWRVTGIAEGEELNMRRGPSIQFSISAKLPHDTRELLNMGCHPDLTLGEWEALSKKERKLAKAMRWCHVMYQGQPGWIYARYLKED